MKSLGLAACLAFLSASVPATALRAADVPGAAQVTPSRLSEAEAHPRTGPAEAIPWGVVGLVIGELAAFGAFGGVLAALSNVPIPKVIEQGLKAYGGCRRLVGVSCLGALWGAGGALALGVILSLDEKFRGLEQFDGERALFIACAAVAAGFSGIKMLKLVSRDLEKKIDSAEKKADEAKQSAQQAKDEIVRSSEQTRQLASALTFAGEILTAIREAAEKSGEGGAGSRRRCRKRRQSPGQST